MTDTSRPFTSLYRHGFVRAAVCIPAVRLVEPEENARAIVALCQRADRESAILALFPELGLTGYSADDLFQQQALLDACEQSLLELAEASAGWEAITAVGLPLRVESKLFNCTAVLHRGQIKGLIPKTYLPNYREYYEERYFATEPTRIADSVELGGREIPFGADIIFRVPGLPALAFAFETCEDLWSPLPPSSFAALAGATVLCNLSASNVTIDKASYRTLLCRAQSGRCVSAYLYAGAGHGESTTDLAWDGHGIVCEYGEVLAETKRFEREIRS